MIGVTGATGEVGGRVARRLARAGFAQRLIVRDMSRAPVLPGAESMEFAGYADADGMRKACAGISTLFLASARESEDRVEQHKLAIDAARSAGVERIVYLSIIGAAPDATFTFARDHFHTEQHIRTSELDFTFSRQNLYMDLLPLLGGEDGVIRGPADDGRLAPVLRDDVADALLTMLTQPGHGMATYELTGPAAFTLTEVAAEVSRFSDRPVRFHNETIEEARKSRAAYGAPTWELAGWISTYTAIAAGEYDVVTDHVQRLTGHRPVSVREFLSREADN
ncbi:MAG: SDR family oxidoreductase [Actinomycetota bacterium]|nr:SDR family oxidoreductase [Actinomycetota bacterium]